MSKKKVLLSVLATAMIVTVSIGATMALLRDTTETVTNTFTSDKSISISLREPLWDGYDFSTPDADYPRGTEATSDDATLGFNMAQHYMYGDAIPKDPTVKNTTTDEDVYVAVTVDCSVSGNAITVDDFTTKIGTIKTNTNWIKIGDVGTKSIYMYGTSEDAATAVAAGGTTQTPVFSQVELNGTELRDAVVLPNFEIKINAYAIQEKGVDVDEAKAELLNFIKPVTTP